MSITATIAPQLPLLRRYARALSGSQTSGDYYVVAMLEALIADHSVFDADAEPRLALYALFSRVWNSVKLNTDVPVPSFTATAERRVDAITPMPRQAFLLTAVEGFSVSEVARILDVDASEVARLIEVAGKEIASQVASTVLIIEDEPIIAMDLESLVTELGHVVVGNARTHREAVAMAKGKRPGLILADIQLADGSSGLEAVKEILESFDVPVIFITAFPESLLTGQGLEPTFLISKPFREDMVKAVVSQALFFGDSVSKPQRQTA